jgi:hypothetical protein
MGPVLIGPVLIGPVLIGPVMIGRSGIRALHGSRRAGV